jgi:hypothetical protein
VLAGPGKEQLAEAVLQERAVERAAPGEWVFEEAVGQTARAVYSEEARAGPPAGLVAVEGWVAKLVVLEDSFDEIIPQLTDNISIS